MIDYLPLQGFIHDFFLGGDCMGGCGRCGGMPPKNILKIRCSKMDSGGFLAASRLSEGGGGEGSQGDPPPPLCMKPCSLLLCNYLKGFCNLLISFSEYYMCDLKYVRTLSRRIILVNCLPSITCYCVIFYRKQMNWYSLRAIIKLLRYQMMLASYTKWPSSKQLKLSI